MNLKAISLLLMTSSWTVDVCGLVGRSFYFRSGCGFLRNTLRIRCAWHGQAHPVLLRGSEVKLRRTKLRAIIPNRQTYTNRLMVPALEIFDLFSPKKNVRPKLMFLGRNRASR